MVEIVLTQMTKTRGRAAGMRGESVADFDVTIRHEDPINQEFHQGPRLRECGMGSAGLHPRPAGFDGRRHLGQRALPIHVSLSLLLLHRQGVVLLLKFLAPSLVFG